MLKVIQAFITGILEFRMSYTTAYNDYDLFLAYERGRSFAHKLTMGKYEG